MSSVLSMPLSLVILDGTVNNGGAGSAGFARSDPVNRWFDCTFKSYRPGRPFRRLSTAQVASGDWGGDTTSEADEAREHEEWVASLRSDVASIEAALRAHPPSIAPDLLMWDLQPEGAVSSRGRREVGAPRILAGATGVSVVIALEVQADMTIVDNSGRGVLHIARHANVTAALAARIVAAQSSGNFSAAIAPFAAALAKATGTTNVTALLSSFTVSAPFIVLPPARSATPTPSPPPPPPMLTATELTAVSSAVPIFLVLMCIAGCEAYRRRWRQSQRERRAALEKVRHEKLWSTEDTLTFHRKKGDPISPKRKASFLDHDEEGEGARGFPITPKAKRSSHVLAAPFPDDEYDNAAELAEAIKRALYSGATVPKGLDRAGMPSESARNTPQDNAPPSARIDLAASETVRSLDMDGDADASSASADSPPEEFNPARGGRSHYDPSEPTFVADLVSAHREAVAARRGRDMESAPALRPGIMPAVGAAGVRGVAAYQATAGLTTAWTAAHGHLPVYLPKATARGASADAALTLPSRATVLEQLAATYKKQAAVRRPSAFAPAPASMDAPVGPVVAEQLAMTFKRHAGRRGKPSLPPTPPRPVELSQEEAPGFFGSPVPAPATLTLPSRRRERSMPASARGSLGGLGVAELESGGPTGRRHLPPLGGSFEPVMIGTQSSASSAAADASAPASSAPSRRASSGHSVGGAARGIFKRKAGAAHGTDREARPWSGKDGDPTAPTVTEGSL